MRVALFWVSTQRVVVISYRRFGTTYRYHPQGSRIQKLRFWTLRMGPMLSWNVGKKLFAFLNPKIGFLTPENGTDRLSWNVGKKLFGFLNPKIGFLNPENGADKLSWNVGKKLFAFLNPKIGFLNPKNGPIGCPETSARNYLDSWLLKKGPAGCTETSLRNYHCSLPNNTEERSSLLDRLFQHSPNRVHSQ